MKKFKFALEPLLRLRKIEENRAMADLARVMQKVNEQEGIKEASARLAAEEMANFERQNREQFDTESYRPYYLYLERLDEEARQAALRLEEMQPELQKEKEKVLEARRRMRVVELLRERQKDQYDRDFQKWERKQLEEANARQTPGALDTQESPYGILAKRWGDEESLDEDGDDLSLDDEEQEKEEIDYIAEYYKSLGIDDPRKGFDQRR